MTYRSFFVLLLLASTVGYAQTRLTDWVNLNCKNAITSICHDANNLYASTMGGGVVQINKRTGEQRCIDHAQDGLPDNYVVSVMVHDGALWTANRFYGISQHTTGGWLNHTADKMGFRTDQWFQSLLFDGNTTWVGGLLALYEMRNGKVVNTYELNPLSSFCAVNDMVMDRDGNLWLAVYDDKSQFALCQLNKSTGVVANKCSTYGSTYALVVDDDNALWVATDAGLLRYTSQKQTLYNSSNTSLPEDAVSNVKMDRKGNIWFITHHNLCCFNRNAFATYSIPYPDDLLNGLDVDGEDVYVGTRQHGLLTLVGNALTPIANHLTSLPTSSMRGGCVDGQGRFWAGMTTGAFAYDPTDHSTDVLTMRQVDEIVPGKQGTLWLKPYKGIKVDNDTCLIEITPTDTTAYLYTDGPFSDNYICQMRVDRLDRLWLATTRGLVCRDNGQWIVYNTANTNLSTNYVYSLDFDSQNRVWCGTFGGGLVCFDGTRFTAYTTRQGLASDYVASVCVDKSDGVWFNCRNSLYPEIYGWGLSTLSDGRVTTYTSDNSPLASNTIWDIQADGRGNLWLATGDDKGVTQFDGAHWQVYNTTNSGLALNEATHITLDEVHNRIWFTCYSGGGVSYAKLENGNTAVSSVNNNLNLTIRNSHLLFAAPTKVLVYDTSGCLVLASQGIDIDLSHLPGAFYVVRASQGAKHCATCVVIP